MINKLIKKFHALSAREKILRDRKSRLNLQTVPTQSQRELGKVRNFSTIAHIDAGKTTLTERLLYFSGALPDMGEVHHGTAFMDFLEDERERGITIKSACITFNWRGYHLNLIDTPGHADFNFEVARSLKVLEGSIVILDALKGVQAQTEKVWSQSSKENQPKICVINKLDRMGADYYQALQTLDERFQIQSASVNLPILEDDEFIGVLCILDQKIYKYEKGSSTGNYINKDMNIYWDQIDDQLKKHYQEHLEKLVEIASEEDENILDFYLTQNVFDLKNEFFENLKINLKESLKKNPNKFCLATPSSALKNKGIPQILDLIVEFLPGPVSEYQNKQTIIGFVFKTLVDPELGYIGLLKLQNGLLSKNLNLINSRTRETLKVNKIYRTRANEYEELSQAEGGDIIAIQTNQQLESGDYIYQETQETQNLPFKGFEKTDPLYQTKLMFKNSKDKKKFLEVIKDFVLEDPSLQLENNTELGEIILKGLGQLHLEIVLNRIEKDFKIKVETGKVQVAYIEQVSMPIESSYELAFNFLRKKKHLQLEFELQPIKSEQENKIENFEVIFDFFKNEKQKRTFEDFSKMIENPEKQKTENLILLKNPISQQGSSQTFQMFEEDYSKYPLEQLKFQEMYLLQKTLQQQFQRGSLTYQPFKNTRLIIRGGYFNPQFLDEVAIRMAVNNLYWQCIQKEYLTLLEPFVRASITCPNEYVSEILNEAITKRDGQQGQNINQMNNTIIELFLPLDNTNNYISYLRSVCQGQVDVTMESSGYQIVPDRRLQILMSRF